MSLFAFSLTFCAAFLHAGWNALAKSSGDRGMMLAGVALSHGLAGLMTVMFFPFPAAAAWPYILASAVLHYGYFALLFQMYRLGDLSVVYPIARGLAPMSVAIGALIFIGETPNLWAWMGLGLVSFGILALGLARRVPQTSPWAVPVAIATGLTIACYSVVDGIGVRSTPVPFSYIAWVFLMDSPVVIFILARRRRFGTMFQSRGLRAGLLGGAGAVAAYAMVLYAKTIAPLGTVSAVRESSVIIAALIGVIVFGERPWIRRVASAAVVGAGVLILALSG